MKDLWDLEHADFENASGKKTMKNTTRSLLNRSKLRRDAYKSNIPLYRINCKVCFINARKEPPFSTA